MMLEGALLVSLARWRQSLPRLVRCCGSFAAHLRRQQFAVSVYKGTGAYGKGAPIQPSRNKDEDEVGLIGGCVVESYG